MSEAATVEKRPRGPARALPALTAKTAASAKGDPKRGRYELRDSGKDHVRGLGLVVQPSGSKTWVLRYEAAGVPRKLTLEPYSEEFGLAAARKLASRFRIKIAEGADPAAEKAEARRKAAAGIDHGAMFSTAWTDWTNAPKPKSRSKKGWRPSTALRAKQDYQRRLEPVWGKRRLDEVTKADVSALLDGIAKQHPQAAARLHRVLASFFNWCVAKGRIQKSPCDGLESAKRNKRKRKLTDAELRWLWLACAKEPFPMGYFVRLLILTLARRNEVAGISRRELHMGNRRTWLLPAHRTKNHHEHEIFLTDAMLDVIKAIPSVKNDAGYLFCTDGENAFSGFSKAKRRLDAAMLKIARAEDPDVESIPNWTLHDLRRTGSTRMQRLGFDNEVAEACLNHVDDDAYLQHDFYEQKVRAFEAWSTEVLRIVGLSPSA
ncbi:tyrosine-type recombinase/integrase [Bradyrhizobium liaoningense]|uniref:tyrosine-type recombinase/integrase n=1 Tax=Bradyrhizobium liaoningense TaxID=43992 RepID=UPI001BA5CAD4|nr:site-specific integrase [Bradyrhizobium liaoningense]MBR0982333.1 site-specific integrase [Bradyrhizobium liaoningense]